MRLSMICTVLFTSAAALAQPPAETCGSGDSLSGADTMPIFISASADDDDFDMTGAGCTELNFDHVTCFTPTDSCTVNARCVADKLLAANENPLGLQVGVNAFLGPCSTAPATCIDSDSGTGEGTITGLSLVGGTEYCFVCETGFAMVSITLDLMVTAGDCGALPVDLLDVEIE